MNFLGISDTETKGNDAKVVILPIPYETTTSYGQGTKNGPTAILKASSQVELFDEELVCEPFTCGIQTANGIDFKGKEGETAIDLISIEAAPYINDGRFLIGLGGEHTITTGLVRAALKKYPNLHIVHFDAHADMRESYEESEWSHACVMKRIVDLGCSYTSIGIRSMSKVEYEATSDSRDSYFFAHEIYGQTDWMDKALEQIKGPVYLTFDVDAFDGSLLPHTGTPEPGGLDWYTVTRFLKRLFEKQDVVAADVVELAPNEQSRASDFMIAKLVYKMIGYRFKS